MKYTSDRMMMMIRSRIVLVIVSLHSSNTHLFVTICLLNLVYCCFVLFLCLIQVDPGCEYWFVYWFSNGLFIGLSIGFSISYSIGLSPACVDWSVCSGCVYEGRDLGAC